MGGAHSQTEGLLAAPVCGGSVLLQITNDRNWNFQRLSCKCRHPLIIIRVLSGTKKMRTLMTPIMDSVMNTITHQINPAHNPNHNIPQHQQNRGRDQHPQNTRLQTRDYTLMSPLTDQTLTNQYYLPLFFTSSIEKKALAFTHNEVRDAPCVFCIAILLSL